MKDLRIDEKGKVFTSHVSKRSVRIVAGTLTNIFHGLVHLMMENRLKDEMNNGERFIAITSVQVYSLDEKKELYTAPLIVLNKEQVVWMMPQGDDDAISTPGY